MTDLDRIRAEQRRIGDCIQTYSGRAFWPLDPKPEEIDIVDIAQALSNQSRYSGHCKWFYSVAQHSVLVSYQCEPASALWGLLHDASEAYMQDVARPLKYLPEMAVYREFEEKLQRAIYERFGLFGEPPGDVKRADQALLAKEVASLMTPGPIWDKWLDVPPSDLLILQYGPTEARKDFLNRFAELTK